MGHNKKGDRKKYILPNRSLLFL